MLPAQNRLRKNSDFQRVYRKGRSWATPVMAMHIVPAECGADPVRIGFTVSKKIGGAVERNLLRRQLREIVRELLPSWRSGADIVLVARSESKFAGYHQLRETLGDLAGRSAMVRGEECEAQYQYPAGGRPPLSRKRSGAGEAATSRSKQVAGAQE